MTKIHKISLDSKKFSEVYRQIRNFHVVWGNPQVFVAGQEFQVGDIVIFKEYDGYAQFTGAELSKVIGYVEKNVQLNSVALGFQMRVM